MIAMIRRLIAEHGHKQRRQAAATELVSFVSAYMWIFDCSRDMALAVYREEKAKKNASYIKNVINCRKA